MKVYLKMVDKVAKKQDSTIFEVLSVFLANLVVGNDDFELIIGKLFKDIDKKERDVLRVFFNDLKEENFDLDLFEFADDYEKAAEHLLMFFLPFLSKEAIESQNPEKIKDSLSVYPVEIKEAILKVLESLSMLKLSIDEEAKKEIIKESLKSIFILYKVMKILGENNET